jgi:hypothetical protein
VRRLKLEDAVTTVCGPIGTVENRIHRLTQQIYELEQNLDRADMSLSWSNGQTFRHEVTPDEKRAALETLMAECRISPSCPPKAQKILRLNSTN